LVLDLTESDLGNANEEIASNKSSSSSSSWRDEAIKRVLHVTKLSEECMKYVDAGKEALANQIFKAIIDLCSRTDSPMKLSDMAEMIYGNSDKGKQDIIRLTIEKTLLRCGIVEKIYFANRDVRYFPSAYRFQEIRRIEDSSGKKIDQLIGEVREVPRKYWPIPKEFYALITSKSGYETALAKLESDFGNQELTPEAYSRIRHTLQNELDRIVIKLKPYQGLDQVMSWV